MKAIDVLKQKIAVTTPFADNENYDIGLTIKEGNDILAELAKTEKENKKLKAHQAMHDDYGNPCTHTEPCNCHCDFADCPYFKEAK